MKTLPTNPRFLICRLSAVGDTVHTLPLANLIKEHWPTAFIAWAVEKGPAPLLQDHPAVDHTVVIPKGFLKSPARLVQIARQLRALKIDVALDPQSLTKSATLAWLSGAKRRIGFTKPIGREIAPWLNSYLVAPRKRTWCGATWKCCGHLECRPPRRTCDSIWSAPRVVAEVVRLPMPEFSRIPLQECEGVGSLWRKKAQSQEKAYYRQRLPTPFAHSFTSSERKTTMP